MSSPTQTRIYNLLKRIPQEGLRAVKELFWTELNYDRANRPLSQRDWSQAALDALAEPPTLLAQHGEFAIIHGIVSPEQQGVNTPLSLTAERAVINQLKNDHPYALYLFSDVDEAYWHFVNVKLDQEAGEKSERTTRRVFRRITVGPGERLRTASERIAMLNVASIQRDLFGLSPLAIQQRHDEAFNVEAVTEKFYQGYVKVFGDLEADLLAQSDDREWAHDFALQFLNRIMFLYYVQRKGWLNEDPDFLSHFWDAYRSADRPEDTFVEEWLNVLFFQAFNNNFAAGRSTVSYMPQHLRDALALAPFLNGGLFSKSRLDEDYAHHEAHITDSRFQAIVSFLDSYNFTISEDTPLDQEVAVDPEMIGKVYESLVNVSEEADERGEAGIFYTPRVEIDLMCRLSLVDWLSNHLEDTPKELLYRAVFAFDPQEKEDADSELRRYNLWPRLDDLLRSVTAVDPACGSGSFLVGMLYVLDDLVERANDQLGREETPYERKKHIIGRSLYGVDVMDWAVHVAELRLWLQLVIDTDLEPAELQFRPLLPNLSFKIRQGDSLVQEVGGVNLAQRHGSRALSPQVKGKITRLQGEKLKFFNNATDARFRTEEQMRRAEVLLFQEILQDRNAVIDERLKEIEDTLQTQTDLFGEEQGTQANVNEAALERERERLQTQQKQVAEAQAALQDERSMPFVWDIAFVEIFSSDRGGFEIVIGNPPYVRQENIRDPRLAPEAVTRQNKKEYKAKLARSVYRAWPRTFGYNWNKDRARWKLDKKSDLYIYFYFHGLSLLNDDGAFCFITSNSWLDVGYGTDLQQFLLKRGRVKLLIDNQSRRSFASAAVNTVITLFGAAEDTGPKRKAVNPDRPARFVMLTVPFEQVLSPVIWEEIQEGQERHTTLEYRVRPFSQMQLLDAGIENGQFAGDKWGGKYLRAPDIYWSLIENHGNQLLRLGDIADVRRGFTTGANRFFFLDHDTVTQWGIEDEYIVPALKSPKECRSIWLNPSRDNFELSLLMCHKDRDELQNTAVLEYIEWGESQNLHERPTLRTRSRWYDLGRRPGACVNCNYLIGTTMKFFGSSMPFYVSDNFQEIHSSLDPLKLLLACNSSVAQLNINVIGRANFGDGLLKLQTYEVSDLIIPDPTLIPDSATKLANSFQLLSLGSEDRQILDNVVYDAMGLDRGERSAVEQALEDLVQSRLAKAGSLR